MTEAELQARAKPSQGQPQLVWTPCRVNGIASISSAKGAPAGPPPLDSDVSGPDWPTRTADMHPRIRAPRAGTTTRL